MEMLLNNESTFEKIFLKQQRKEGGRGRVSEEGYCSLRIICMKYMKSIFLLYINNIIKMKKIQEFFKSWKLNLEISFF